MNINNSHNIDNQVRQATNSIDTEFNEEAWQKMEKLLDKKQPNRPFGPIFNWRNLFIGLLMLNVLVATFLITKNYVSNKKLKTESTNKPNVVAPKTTNESKATIKNSSNTEVATFSQPKVNEIKQQSNTNFITNNQLKRIAENSIKPIRNNEILNDEHTVNRVTETKKAAQKEIEQSTDTEIVIENKKANENETVINLSTYPKSSTKNNEITDTSVKQQSNSDTSALVLQTNTTNSNATNSLPKFKMGWNKLFFTANKSVEINTIKLRGKNTWVSNSSFGIGVLWTNKNSISVHYTKASKIYDTDKYGYKNLNPYYLLYDTLNIHARCQLSNIDINIKHYFNSFLKSSVFIMGGVGLNKLNNEAYLYEYYDRGTLKSRYRAFNNPSTYQITNINFMAGYQYRFNKMVSLFTEGFIQYPIKGVGVGSINITSIGTRFGVTVFPFK
jgi:hypothetical protein